MEHNGGHGSFASNEGLTASKYQRRVITRAQIPWYSPKLVASLETSHRQSSHKLGFGKIQWVLNLSVGTL